ncbi:PTS N-acetylglucosamine transporter subunit IIBC (plasmid) [Lactiplantibacillus plantarum]|uniref:PTS N-acetylglucosamine transporter subunit IIBC n=1 Tax=Lactiplantibacillus plantarum TaxID=1590 RepID=A0AAX1KE71_LACPN|nr:PTS N-acetylglucosamine transporter subunit IIBC [Lactiplantibacillus plantarum]QQM62627.1 PTS N-acetylglucosamine transporter subunit IIBC [Lactiplantibacillus plantarum]
MMRRIVIVTHRTFAKGLADSLNFFSNQGDKITAINAYVEDNNFPAERIAKLFANFGTDDEVIIMTDILSGSVTQKMYSYMNDHTFLVSGVNLPLALSLILIPENERLTLEKIQQLIQESKQQIILVNQQQGTTDDEDE